MNTTPNIDVYMSKPEIIPSNNLFASATTSGSGQSCFDPYYLSSDEEAFSTAISIAETIPGYSDYPARLSIAARIYLY